MNELYRNILQKHLSLERSGILSSGKYDYEFDKLISVRNVLLYIIDEFYLSMDVYFLALEILNIVLEEKEDIELKLYSLVCLYVR